MASASATVITYGATIDACETGQQPERLLVLLAVTRGLMLETRVTTYSAAINVRGDGNNLDAHLSC